MMFPCVASLAVSISAIMAGVVVHFMLLQPTQFVATAELATQVVPFSDLEGGGQNPFLARDISYDDIQTAVAWKDKSKYYYTDVRKRIESIVSPACHSEISYHTGEWNDEVRIFNDTIPNVAAASLSSSSHITVVRLRAADSIAWFWQQIPPPTQMRTDEALCNATWHSKKSLFNRRYQSRICNEVLHTGAPRCQPSYLEAMCYMSMTHFESTAVNHFHLPEANHVTSFSPPEPYLIRISNARVAVCGQVSLSCGTLSPATLCDRAPLLSFSKEFHEKCSAAAVAASSGSAAHVQTGSEDGSGSPAAAAESSSCAAESTYGSLLHHFDRVFVVAQPDDSHIYHVQIEVLPKIAYHLEFLLANPDIKILIGCDFSKKMKKENRRKSIRFQKLGLLPVLSILGLSLDRFIFQKNVVAKEVFLPSEGACQDPVSSTWQVLTMRHQVLSKLRLSSGVLGAGGTVAVSTPRKPAGRADHSATDDDQEEGSAEGAQMKPVMLLIKRSKRSTSTRQRKDGFRQWSDEFTANILVMLKETFPRYQVRLYSDMDQELMDSVPKQIALFHRASVVIGVHGAGLGHMLYMKPNSVIIEIAPAENDGRLHLGGGPFNRLSTLLAHNYLVHFPLKSELVFKDREIEFDVQRLVTHTRSFLTSLNL